jgi:hypothetical protein
MNISNDPKAERRRFPRVAAPVFYRSPRLFSLKQKVSNISPAGVRIYSDDLLEEGRRLELEFFLPSGYSMVAIARVVWIKELPPDYEEKYEVGLEFIHLPPVGIDELKSVLKKTSS